MRIPASAAALLAASCVSAGEYVPSIAGPWGGPMVTLDIGEGGAVMRESCGEIALDAVRPDAAGRFTTRGRKTRYAPGPQPADGVPPATLVSVTGRVEGEIMVLTVAEPGASPRDVTLHKGRRGKIIRCY